MLRKTRGGLEGGGKGLEERRLKPKGLERGGGKEASTEKDWQGKIQEVVVGGGGWCWVLWWVVLAGRWGGGG